MEMEIEPWEDPGFVYKCTYNSFQRRLYAKISYPVIDNTGPKEGSLMSHSCSINFMQGQQRPGWF